MDFPVTLLTDPGGLVIDHKTDDDKDDDDYTTKHYFQTIGVFDGEIFMIELLRDISKVHRFSVLTGKHTKTHIFHGNDVFGARLYNFGVFEICANLEDPNNPLIFFTDDKMEGLYRCNLGDFISEENLDPSGIPIISTVTNDINRRQFIIDHKRRNLYIFNRVEVIDPDDPINSKFVMTEIKIDSLQAPKEIYQSSNRHAFLHSFDQEQDLLIFSTQDKGFSLSSFDPSTKETKSVILKSVDVYHGFCCCRDGVLSNLNVRTLKTLYPNFLETNGLSELENNMGIVYYDYCGVVTIYPTKIDVETIFFDWDTGTIVMTGESKTQILHPDEWIHTSPPWSPQIHQYKTERVRKIVKMFTMIRSLCLELIISLLPNELLFEIFRHL